MEEYKSNSNKLRDGATEEAVEKAVGPVISGSAKAQKKTGFGKLASSIIAEDAKNVCSYLLTDVIIPSCKKVIHDIITDGADMFLYGKSGTTKASVSASKVSYGSYFQSGTKLEPLRVTASSSSIYDYDNIVFDNRGDAEVVVEAMEDIVNRFGVVSVGDLYDLADLPSPNYTVHKYGWNANQMHTAQVVRHDNDYIIKLPRATQIS